MLSYQLTSLLWVCLSGIWLVHAKPNSAIPGIHSLPESGNDLRHGQRSLVHATAWDKSFTAPGQHDIFLTPPFSHSHASIQNLGKSDAVRQKRTPSGFTARGFHEGVFDRDFGHFSPVKRTSKRRPEADASGFYGDTFSNGFGEFETMKRDNSYLTEDDIRRLLKRTEMRANGFDSDTFNQGFGKFETMKRRLVNLAEAGVVKRGPEMTKSGFHGDVFTSGFGEFHPMKK